MPQGEWTEAQRAQAGALFREALAELEGRTVGPVTVAEVKHRLRARLLILPQLVEHDDAGSAPGSAG